MSHQEVVPHGISAYSYDFPPGTERVDASGQEETVHYPMPDNDPHDPLTWSTKRKALTFGIGVWYTFMSTVPLLAFNSIYPTMIADFKTSPTKLSQSAGWAGLVLALGVIIVGPASSAFGRRPTLFYSNLLNIGALIFYARVTNYTTLFWARNLQGLACAAIEIVAITQVGDLFFTAEAGLYHALGLLPLIIAVSAGSPVLAAFIQRGWSWRAFLWMFVGVGVLTQILIFFCLPETYWPRTAESSRGVATNVIASDDSTDEEKRAPSARVDDVKQTEIVSLVGRGAPSRKQKYNIFPSVNRDYNPLVQLKNIAILMTFTPVLLTNLVWTAIGGASVGFGFITSSIYYAPPYLFSPSQVGLTALPNILGGLIGLFLVGPISDWDLARRTRKNGGVREAEMRLWVALYGGLLTIVTLVIYGLAIERKWHYLIILIPGATCFSAVSVFPVVAAINYATDTYKKYPLEISFSMSITKGLWTFGLGYIIEGLYVKRGALVCIMLCSIPIFVAVAVIAFLLFVGKPLRRLTSNSSILQ